MRKLFRDITIAKKIGALVVVTMLMMTLVIGIGVRQVQAIGNEVEILSEETVPLLESVTRLTFHNFAQFACLMRAIQAGKRLPEGSSARALFEAEEKEFFARGQLVSQEIDKSRILVERILETCKTHLGRHAVQSIDYQFRQIAWSYADHQLLARRAMNLLSQGKVEEAEPTILKCQGKEGYLGMVENVKELSLTIGVFVRETTLSAKQSERAAIIGMSLSSTVILVVALSLGIAISRSITGRVHVAVEVADQIAKGERNPNIPDVGKNEMGTLLTAMKRMCEAVSQAEDGTNAANRRLQANEKEAIRARENLTAILTQSLFGVVVIGRDRKIRWANHYAGALVGAEDADALCGEECAEYLCPAQQKECPILDKGQAINNSELILRRHDGREVPILKTVTEIELDGEQVLLESFVDITTLKTLENEAQRLAVIVEQAVEGIAVADLEGNIQFANLAWAAMHGYDSPEELVAKPLSIFHTEEQLRTDVVPFNERIMQRGHNSGEVGHMRKDGTTFPTLMTVALLRDVQDTPCAMAAFAQDATDGKSLQAQLSQAQKLEAVGQLASGIAHEINTPAQFVGDSIHFLKEAFEDQRELTVKYRQAVDALGREAGHENLLKEILEAEDTADLKYFEEHVPGAFERCIDGLSRISSIVGAMKEFAHPDQREKSAADLNQALETTLIIAKNEYKYVADIETELGELPPVSCYVGDLNQVFLNLFVNAAHAIGEVVGDTGGRGAIRVRTAHDGDSVRIEIEDTGCGMPASVQDRIFEPFFTTKEVGKGSGQGLPIARSVVVDKHNGSLTCRSDPGKGSTFIIRLPIDGKGETKTEAAT